MVASPNHREGTTFGTYVIEELIGQGGMGEVYRAVDSRRGRTVALKLLGPAIANDPVARERFLRESRMAAALNDPHVIPIHDWGEVDGQLFIDMRLVVGRDLRRVIAEDGPMSPQVAIDIVEQLGCAIDSAHRAGLVHRDVKPDNALIDGHDFAYLVDFGLAISDTDTRFTQAGFTVGSFRYMAPERFGDGEIGPAVDIYSLTCVLLECLTGAPPFARATSAEQIMAAHLRESPEPLDSPLNAVIRRGMAKAPAERFPTAAALVAAARQSLVESPDRDQHSAGTSRNSTSPMPTFTRTGSGESQALGTPSQYAITTIRPVRRSRRSVGYAVIGAVVAAVVLSTVGWIISTRSDSDVSREVGSVPSAATTVLTVTTTHQPPESISPTTTVAASAPPTVHAGAVGDVVWHKMIGSAAVSLWLSSSGHNWVTVATGGGLSGSAQIWSPLSGWRASPAYSVAPAHFATPQVYAPGSTCIRVIVNYGSESMNEKIC